MKATIVNYEKQSNRYKNIRVKFDNGTIKTYKDTAELRLELSRYQNLVCTNFDITPDFKYHPDVIKTGNTTPTNTSTNEVDLTEIKSMLTALLARPELDMTSLVPVDNSGRLDRIEQNIAAIMQKLDMQYNMSAQIQNYIQNNTEEIKDYLHKKIEPMYLAVVDNLYKELKKRGKAKYGKCESDKNTWRYESLPEEALNFVGEIKHDANGYLSVAYDELMNDESDCRNAFSGINLLTSGLNLEYNSVDILKMRDLVKIMAETRIVTEKALDNDADVTKTKGIENSSDLELNLLLGCYNSIILTGLKGISTAVNDKIGKASLCYTLVVGVFKVIGTEIRAVTASGGLSSSAINAYGVDLPYGARLQDSTLSVDATVFDKLTQQDLGTNLKNYVLESCRVLTINKRKSFIKGTNAEKHPSRMKQLKNKLDLDIKKSPCYKFVKNTAVTCVTADIRLYMTYLQYCQQPYFGFVVRKYKIGTKDRVGNNEQQVREFLFTRLQNAYFAAKIMLMDCQDANMVIGLDRLNWLDAYDYVGTSYPYDRTNFRDCQRYLHIERFLEYLKLGICMQDISPLCADKLVQLFCNYGKIDWKVDSDTENSICSEC